MKSWNDVTSGELVWAGCKGKKGHYELRAGQDVAAALVWEKGSGAQVTASIEGASWTLVREGFFRQRIIARVKDQAEPAAIMELGAMGGGVLTVTGGKSYRWRQRSLFGNTWGFSLDDKPVVGFKLDSGLMSTSAATTLEAADMDKHEQALLVIMGWFALLLYAEDIAPTGL